MKPVHLASESFSSGRRHYYLDFNRAVNQRDYIRISRNDELGGNRFDKRTVVVFEEDFEFLIQAFASLFRTAAYSGKEVRVQDLKRSCSEEGQPSGIKSWPVSERPREKLVQHGPENLSDAELLAILIGSGTPGRTVVDLAQQMMSSVQGDLKRLAGLTSDELCRFKGIGVVRSLTIIAAMELSARMAGIRVGSVCY
ncbi:hypothetical protein GS399_05585 [Pedobacter sp. HMF7647]|uniref:UPF0758 domain-containing protein n=1 Tax=Hufsiella arboris TaxID=2695275 RepID=A0A7K1Y8R9_9SPHI|nr:UPF0758 domain-containing protein [Hufsiella arboris]MXV50438.1 hypothetical protein [Hufsiella arboris]